MLLDTSTDVFHAADASWLEDELTAHQDEPTVIAIHQPPFETGIWWMDCVGLKGAELFEVANGVWQVRGYDIANITFIEGRTGWVVLLSKL